MKKALTIAVFALVAVAMTGCSCWNPCDTGCKESDCCETTSCKSNCG